MLGAIAETLLTKPRRKRDRMIVLAKCALERLRTDDIFTLYRAHQADGSPSRLALVPRQPTIRSLEKLENEYALAADLDPAWAVIPIQLIPHKENMMLVFEDPGGETLADVLQRPLELHHRLRLAVGLADAVGKLHRYGLLHRDIKPGNILVPQRNSIRLTGFGNAIHQTHQKSGARCALGNAALHRAGTDRPDEPSGRWAKRSLCARRHALRAIHRRLAVFRIHYGGMDTLPRDPLASVSQRTDARSAGADFRHRSQASFEGAGEPLSIR